MNSMSEFFCGRAYHDCGQALNVFERSDTRTICYKLLDETRMVVDGDWAQVCSCGETLYPGDFGLSITMTPPTTDHETKEQ